jgi:glycosyltransferase involved in cell wall biosynthesis
MPRTSILLPVRDGWPHVREAVTSTLDDVGHDPDAELVLIDDGSTDAGSSWLAEAAAERPRVRLVRAGGVGLPAALNTGLAQSDSEYVARMDADDVWLPGRLAAQTTAMARAPELAAAGCQIVRFVEGRDLAVSRLPTEHDGIVTALLRGHHGICHPSVIMRRSALDAVGGYWAEGVAEDFDLFLRMSEVGRLANLPFVGIRYLFHASGINAGRQYDVQKRMAFSAATYRQPRGFLSYAEFERALQGDRRRAADLRRRALGLSLYRSGLVHAHSERRARGRLQLLASAALMPERAVQRLVRR